ncbi:MAG TPA: heavy metal-binding domain-containing protein [Candidatus Baltobacteraceae bacterium]|jgi:uncharacterized protein YbjQ (UPF0145 family)|nr:heavy metal-binding domain-containing protein [Candidatus Baltobacteraceae bacterium]
MVADKDIVTFEDLAGYRVVRRFGYVSGIASRPRNRLRSTFRSLGMLIGVSPSEFQSDAEHLRTEALEGVYKRANAFGANAVIGLSFHVSESPDGSCKVVAFGEAVLVTPDDGA